MIEMLVELESWQVGCLVLLGCLVIGGLLALVNDERAHRWPTRDVDARSVDRESGRRILETADLVESRMYGRRRGEKVRLLAPPREIEQHIDFDARVNLDWVRREGRDYGVEVVEHKNCVRAMNRGTKVGGGEADR
jgi:hypothetical protein